MPTGLPKRPVRDAGEAVIRVSVSYRVNRADTDVLRLGARLEVDLSVPDPARNIVRSEEQVRAYGSVFRETLDGLRKVMPACRRVHLFYAGPMALAFHLGQMVSENIHPPVAVWNYSRGYEWAIDMAAAVSGEPCVIRAGIFGSEGT